VKLKHYTHQKEKMVMLDIDDELIVVKQSEQIYMYHK